MKDRLLLLTSLLALGVLSTVHDPLLLAGALGLVLILGRSDALPVLRRALLAVLLFSGTVSAVHAVVVIRAGSDPTAWLLSTNLRVLAMTSLTLLTARRVDLLRVAAPWPTLRFVLVLALAQIAVLRKLVDDFRLALRSRGVIRPGPALALRHGGAVGAALLRKADHDTTTLTQAMTSRGFFIDADHR